MSSRRRPIAERDDAAGSANTNFDALPIAICVTAAVGVAVYLLARFLVPALHIRPKSDLTFLPEFDNPSVLSPKPVEQQQYLLTVVATLVLPLLIALAVTRGRSALGACRRLTPALLLAVLVLVVVACVNALPQARMWWPNEIDGLGVLALVALVAGAVLLRGRLQPLGLFAGLRWELVAVAVALVATVLLCLAGFYTDHNVALAPVPTAYHVPFTFEEVYAVVGGHTPLVNWVPQYVTLLPYLLAPALSLRAPSIGMFTFSMTVLSTASLMCGYFALRLLVRRPLPAVLSYLPVLALSLVPVSRAGAQVFTAGTYFAVMPFRYAGPLACLAAVAALARWNPGARSWLLFGLLEGLVVLNNFEFGLPAAVAGLAAVVLAQDPGRPLAVRRSLRVLALTLAGAVIALALFVALTLIRSGQLPDLGDLVWFDREFANAGFQLVPMDGFVSLQGIVFLTFVGALVLGSVPALLGRGRTGIEGRVSTAILTFTGIFGIGAFAYYEGRSLPSVLVAIFCAWGFALAALSIEGVRYLRRWRSAPAAATLAVLPMLAFALVGFGSLLQDDYAFAQPARALSGGQSPIYDPSAAIGAVRACLRPGTNAGVLMDYGLRIAADGDIHDWFPYNNQTDLVTRQQVAITLTDLRKHNARVIVSDSLTPSVVELIGRAGYRPLFTDAAAGTDFWVRGSARVLHC